MGWVVNVTPWRLYPWEGDLASWVGLRDSMNGCGYFADLRTVQPVVSCCVDYAISAHQQVHTTT
jgi:hypothetical protein